MWWLVLGGKKECRQIPEANGRLPARQETLPPRKKVECDQRKRSECTSFWHVHTSRTTWKRKKTTEDCVLTVVSLMLKLSWSWLNYALPLLDQKKGEEAGREGPRESREGTLTQIRCHMENPVQRSQVCYSLLHISPKHHHRKFWSFFRFEKSFLVHSWLCHVKFQDSVLDSRTSAMWLPASFPLPMASRACALWRP